MLVTINLDFLWHLSSLPERKRSIPSASSAVPNKKKLEANSNFHFYNHIVVEIYIFAFSRCKLLFSTKQKFQIKFWKKFQIREDTFFILHICIYIVKYKFSFSILRWTRLFCDSKRQWIFIFFLWFYIEPQKTLYRLVNLTVSPAVSVLNAEWFVVTGEIFFFTISDHEMVGLCFSYSLFRPVHPDDESLSPVRNYNCTLHYPRSCSQACSEHVYNSEKINS